MGVHPYHYRCLDLYACLTSACRVCAKLGAGRVALRRAAMYALLQAGAVEAVLAVGAIVFLPRTCMLQHWKLILLVLHDPCCSVFCPQLSCSSEAIAY